MNRRERRAYEAETRASMRSIAQDDAPADHRARMHLLNNNALAVDVLYMKAARQRGTHDLVVLLADLRDPLGRQVALVNGYSEEEVARQTAEHAERDEIATCLAVYTREQAATVFTATHPLTGEALQRTPPSDGSWVMVVAIAANGVTLARRPVALDGPEGDA